MLTIDEKITTQNDAQLVQNYLANHSFNGCDDDEQILATAAITRLKARLSVLKNKSELFKNITLSSKACQMLR